MSEQECRECGGLRGWHMMECSIGRGPELTSPPVFQRTDPVVVTFTKEQIIRCLTAFVPPDLADQAEEIARREVVKIEGSAQAAVLGDFADRLGRIPNEHLLWLTGKKARDEIATAARNWATFRADFPLFDPPTGGN